MKNAWRVATAAEALAAAQFARCGWDQAISETGPFAWAVEAERRVAEAGRAPVVSAAEAIARARDALK